MQCPKCGGDILAFKKLNPTPIYPLAGLLIAPIEELEAHFALRPFEEIILLCPNCGDVLLKEVLIPTI